MIFVKKKSYRSSSLSDEATLVANIPASVLSCEAVSRVLTFHSLVEIRHLRLEQQILLHGVPIEELKFDFGYVIPGSTNTWEQVIASEQGSMMDAAELSGNLIIANAFFDGDQGNVVARCNVRLFYV